MKKIKEIIMSPSFDRKEALQLHKKMLLEKRARLDKVIATIDKTIQHTKEIEMTNKENLKDSISAIIRTKKKHVKDGETKL